MSSLLFYHKFLNVSFVIFCYMNSPEFSAPHAYHVLLLFKLYHCKIYFKTLLLIIRCLAEISLLHVVLCQQQILIHWRIWFTYNIATCRLTAHLNARLMVFCSCGWESRWLQFTKFHGCHRGVSSSSGHQSILRSQPPAVYAFKSSLRLLMNF